MKKTTQKQEDKKPCQPEAQPEPKCKACQDKGYYTQFVGESGSDDFGGEGYSLPPTIKKFPCPKCIHIQNGHKEDCDFVNYDQGVCNCFSPKPQEKSEQGILQDGEISHPQPTDGLENWWEDFNKREALNGFTGWPLWMKDYIDDLLAEQKQKTREDTLNNIEAIWTRLMNETDDPAYKEVYARCIKALKI